MTDIMDGASSATYKGHEIEVDQDGHITVWELDNGSPDGHHWTEPTVATAKAMIDRVTAPAPMPMVGLLLLDARQQMIEGGPR
jgi:hypothetical protein